ncbi:vacuolar ATPase assembly integral membrane protein vma21 [Entomortierella chlamydospora]|nr:vacuolar ATPase assembly integral membrane protein vma21 [Entomortierella chlamydospora]
MNSQEKASTSASAAPRSLGSSSSSSSPAVPSTRSPNVATSTLAKLAFFTMAMICLPIGTYFITLDHYFDGNATYAGISAAVMANLVLFAYVIVAVLEDSQASRPPVSIKKQQ